MATQYTPILQLALPVTGELNGTWGDVVNDSITSMIEQAVAGAATISSWTGASHTLTTADGSTDEARCAMLICSGTPGAAAEVICPARTKLYVVTNNVSGGYAVTIKTASGTGVAVTNGKSVLVYCDGTNVVEASNGSGVTSFSAGTTGLTPSTTTTGAVTLAGTLAVANGGTGQTSYTDGQILIGNSTGNTLAKATLTAGTGISVTNGSGSITIANSGVATYPGAGMAVSTGSAWGTSKTTPTGDVVGTSDSQTLTNKTFTGYTETVYALSTSGSVALNPANGTIQTCASSGTVTFTDSLSAGQSIVLMITGGTTNTINWPTTTWVSTSGNSAPTLTASSVVVFWKVSTTLYGSYVGSYA